MRIGILSYLGHSAGKYFFSALYPGFQSQSQRILRRHDEVILTCQDLCRIISRNLNWKLSVADFASQRFGADGVGRRRTVDRQRRIVCLRPRRPNSSSGATFAADVENSLRFTQALPQAGQWCHGHLLEASEARSCRCLLLGARCRWSFWLFWGVCAAAVRHRLHARNVGSGTGSGKALTATPEIRPTGQNWIKKKHNFIKYPK